MRAEQLGVGQLQLARRRAAVHAAASSPATLTFNNPNNLLTNVSVLDKNWDFNPSVGGPIAQGQGLVLRHLPLLGREQDDRRQLLRRRSRRRSGTSPDLDRAGHRRRPHPQHRGPRHGAGHQQGQGLLLPRRAGQGARALGHRREHSARGVGDPGDADQLRVGVEVDAHRTPTGCCSTPGSASTTRSIRRTISRRSLRRRAARW